MENYYGGPLNKKNECHRGKVKVKVRKPRLWSFVLERQGSFAEKSVGICRQIKKRTPFERQIIKRISRIGGQVSWTMTYVNQSINQ